MKYTTVESGSNHWSIAHLARPYSDTPCECGYVFSDDVTVADVFIGVHDVSYKIGSDEWYSQWDKPRTDEAKGNAVLIAYAPTMYELLKKLSEERMLYSDDQTKRILDLIEEMENQR